MRGGRIDFRIFGRKHWRPAQIKGGIDPIRGLYDLRHTYATFALRAGVPVFAVSRFMGTSIAMIDRHYGHPPTTAATTQSPSSTRSPSSERWTLRGRRRERLEDQSGRQVQACERISRAGAWTLGGRRASSLSTRQTTNEPDWQR